MVGVVEEVVRVGEGGRIWTQLLSFKDREGDTRCGTSGPPMDPSPAAAAAISKVSSKIATGVVGVPEPPEDTSPETEPPTPVTPCAPGWGPTGAVQNAPNNTGKGTGKGGVCHIKHSCICRVPRLVVILTRP
ncbi:hypothetical protein QL285_059216 [Trifolium repens]|nr:hypothetical protein QL285_059216 [Trifolium repens]